MNTKDNSTQISNDTSSGAAVTTLREKIRGSWRWKRNASGGLTTGGSTIQLAPRDFEILRFVLDMKFATHIEIHQKFFRKRLDTGADSVSLIAAKKRIQKLEEADFLRADFVKYPRTKHVILSRKGFSLIQEKFPDSVLGLPMLYLDQRLVNHDRHVMHERLRLEAEEGVTQWISERALQTGVLPHLSLEQRYFPDAIYLLPTGDRVALEMEVAVKSKRAYQEKVEKYVAYFSSTAETDRAFQKVRFLSVEKIAHRNLTQHCGIFPSLFQVDLLSEILNPKVKE